MGHQRLFRFEGFQYLQKTCCYKIGFLWFNDIYSLGDRLCGLKAEGPEEGHACRV